MKIIFKPALTKWSPLINAIIGLAVMLTAFILFYYALLIIILIAVIAWLFSLRRIFIVRKYPPKNVKKSIIIEHDK